MGRLTQILCRGDSPSPRHFVFQLMLVGLLTGPAAALTEADVQTRVEIARAQIEAGDIDMAETVLRPLYDEVYDSRDLPPRVAYAPLLGLAYVAYARENWAEVERYAGLVANGLSIEENVVSDDMRRARALQGAGLYHLGQAPAADQLLREALNDWPEGTLPEELQLALYVLARVASDERLSDEREMRNYALTFWRPGGLVPEADVLHLMFLDIVYGVRSGEPSQELELRMDDLRTRAGTIPNIAEGQVMHYRGYHGYLLARVGRFDRALSHLQAYHDYLRDNGRIGRDLWENTLFLGSVLGRVRGPDTSIRFFEARAPEAEAAGASDWYLAQYSREMGHAAAALGDAGRAQDYYRAAYAIARRSYRTNAGLVVSLRAFIDTADPGMIGYAFAAELGALQAATFAPEPFGEEVLRLVLNGLYPVLPDLVAGSDADGTALQLNLALGHALTGQIDAALAALDRAEAQALFADSPDVPGRADLVEAMARIWGSTSDVAAGGVALARLGAVAGALPPALQRMTRALEAQLAYHAKDQEGMQAALLAFDDVAGDPGQFLLWDLFAAAVLQEVLWDLLPEAEARYASLKARLAMQGGLSVLNDHLEVMRYQASNRAFHDPGAVAALSGIATRLAEDLPAGHALRLIARFTLSSAFYWRGDLEAAFDWAGRAAEEARATRWAPPGVLALILSRQSDLARALGRNEVAATLAQQGFALLQDAERPGEFGAAVLESHARAVWAFTGDARRVDVLLDEALAVPEFTLALAPVDRVALLTLRAEAQAGFAPPETVLNTLDHALEVMDGQARDWQRDRSRVLWTRARVQHKARDRAGAFADMVASNRLYHKWRTTLGQDVDGADPEPRVWRDRAVWEAATGWQLSQSMAAEGMK